MTEKNDFSNYKKDTLTRPRDAAWSNWHSWNEAVIGDNLQGYIADAFYRPEEKNEDGSVAFRGQRGVTLKKLDGELVNVGIKDLSFVLAATDNLRVGDPLTIEFAKVLPPAKKGQKGPKVFDYFGKNLEASAGNKTVKQLTDEDRIAGGSLAPEVAKTEDQIQAEKDFAGE